MKDVIISLLGEYTPKTYPDGSPMGGLASLDYEWLVGAAMFGIITIIVVKCISSLLVAAFKGGN